MTVTQLVKKSDAAAEFGTLLQSPAMLSQLRMALPKTVTPERLARLVLTEVRRIPGLLQCDRSSLLGAVMQAAQLGLEPGVLGQCWIIPYKGKATFVLGYRGAAQLAWRSGMIAGLSSRAVYEGDHFAYDFGSDKIEHIPCGETDPRKLTHAWTAVHTTTGGRVWDVMLRREIDAIRARSASGNDGPWVTDFAEMAKKTVFKRNMKLAPCSVELQQALNMDDAADQGIPQGIDFEVPEAPAIEANGSAPESPQAPRTIEGPAQQLNLASAIKDRLRVANLTESGATRVAQQIEDALRGELGDDLTQLDEAKAQRAGEIIRGWKIELSK